MHKSMRELLYQFSNAKLCIPALLLFFCGICSSQQTYPPGTNCPVLASLASSKVHSDKGDSIVIWFWNQGKKTAHGIQFKLFMLDVAGNRFPASQLYQAKGDTKPQSGDVVIYPTTDEEQYFGDKWKSIDGVEVHVTRILFNDASAWVPRKGVDCKTTFLNDGYDKEMESRDKIITKKLKALQEQWDKEDQKTRENKPK